MLNVTGESTVTVKDYHSERLLPDTEFWIKKHISILCLLLELTELFYFCSNTKTFLDGKYSWIIQLIIKLVVNVVLLLPK